MPNKAKLSVGDTWTFTCPRHCEAKVWLCDKTEGLQVWRYEFRNSDGRLKYHDWATSYRNATALAIVPFDLGIKIRFKKSHDKTQCNGDPKDAR